jgi:hypothetical protein
VFDPFEWIIGIAVSIDTRDLISMGVDEGFVYSNELVVVARDDRTIFRPTYWLKAVHH